METSISNPTVQEFVFKLNSWVNDHVLGPKTFTLFLTYAMQEVVFIQPRLHGFEKKQMILDILDTILRDPTIENIQNRSELHVALESWTPSLIDFGVDAQKQKYHFKSHEVYDPQNTTTENAVAQVSRIAQEWFHGKTVTTLNIIAGISAIMEAAGQFMNGPGSRKKEIVLQVVREIVQSPNTKLKDDDREAILLVINTFAPQIIDFGINLATGNFDFKGLVEDFQEMCGGCWPYCCSAKPNTSKPPTTKPKTPKTPPQPDNKRVHTFTDEELQKLIESFRTPVTYEPILIESKQDLDESKQELEIETFVSI